ncbi:phosphate/sulfate permease [Maribacter vaceletii]|uniref:Phosphate transporter n=1 Tax=Maribacter vaceletii TaxID=1206816 RepID=A0A495ECS9_9FLAO|nr:inorganic phosphate transporter [Maribacter vaceletii]RKR14606.1 phosphate/sulfate permease [Maribacter vaceletii]
MDNVYLIMIVALAFLAIADLVVGVSNDAVNFLNSAIGSKAISFKTIMIVASIGIACGAIFSSGMMEVARKDIFNPGEFYFNEIMFIFMAVMITDILLLDFFNTLGMPTSTTVSIVFELLGAAVAMALIKIANNNGAFSEVVQYINTEKAVIIIAGIVLSILIAFTIGALVQWLTRLLISFDFKKKPKWVGAVFGGIALTAISYFILIEGIKGTTLVQHSFKIIGNITLESFIEQKPFLIIFSTFSVLIALSFLLISFTKINIYKLIITVGTFALALAFAGNDLMNFIGVPIAAWQSYEAWEASGVLATKFSMEILSQKVPTPNILLFIAGIIMVVTLWFSSKAKAVVKTSIDLSSQERIKERFQPNFISRSLVRFAVNTSEIFTSILSKNMQDKIEIQFTKTAPIISKDKPQDLPAFDMVRAAVNLMVAGILISIATSFKLPLSTTYVTFMVGMGTSLADRAWGAESAVYRVAGVLNVIGGWFGTALIAFIASGGILTIIYFGKGVAITILLFAVFFLLLRSYISYNRKNKILKEEDSLSKAESSSIQGVIEESAHNVARVVKRANKIFTTSFNSLAKQDLETLKKNKKGVVRLSEEIDDLRDHIFYFIKNLDEASVGASNFYINILGYLQAMTQSLEYIAKVTHKHISNNHKKLKYNQIKELKEIEIELIKLFTDTQIVFENRSFEEIESIVKHKNNLFNLVSEKIEKQVARTRTEESSPKNTTLYFTLLLETKDLITATMNLLESYYKEHDSSVKPATIDKDF